jgi:hypothetical protein
MVRHLKNGDLVPEFGMNIYTEWTSPAPHGHGLDPAVVKPDTMYDAAEFREGYAQLEAKKLSFEAWCFHQQIPMVRQLNSIYSMYDACYGCTAAYVHHAPFLHAHAHTYK